jgi:hypothetical protein
MYREFLRIRTELPTICLQSEKGWIFFVGRRESKTGSEAFFFCYYLLFRSIGIMCVGRLGPAHYWINLTNSEKVASVKKSEETLSGDIWLSSQTAWGRLDCAECFSFW